MATPFRSKQVQMVSKQLTASNKRIQTLKDREVASGMYRYTEMRRGEGSQSTLSNGRAVHKGEAPGRNSRSKLEVL
jgi:hypothetical protein